MLLRDLRTETTHFQAARRPSWESRKRELCIGGTCKRRVGRVQETRADNEGETTVEEDDDDEEKKRERR